MFLSISRGILAFLVVFLSAFSAGCHSCVKPMEPAVNLAPLTVQSDRPVFYVDADHGDDGNLGTSEATAWKSPKFKSGSSILFKRGCSWTATFRLDDIQDLFCGAYGDGGPNPQWHAIGGANLVTFNSNTARVTLESLDFISDYSNQTKNGFTWHKALANFGNIRGTDIRISDCGLGPISEGFAAAWVNKLTIHQCNQLDPIGIQARFFFASHVENLVFDFNTATGSMEESPFRCTDDGILVGAIVLNVFTQPLGEGRNAYGDGMVKACVTIRSGHDIAFSFNSCINGALSCNTDTTGKQTTTHSLFQHNVVTNSIMQIRQGSIGNCWTDNDVRAPLLPNGQDSATPCIMIDADPNSNNQLEYCTCHGNFCGVKSFTTNGTRVSHIVLYSHNPATPCLVTKSSSDWDDDGTSQTELGN